MRHVLCIWGASGMFKEEAYTKLEQNILINIMIQLFTEYDRIVFRIRVLSFRILKLTITLEANNEHL